MNTAFEIWDDKTHNVLQFDHLDQAIVAVRGLIQRDGTGGAIGLSLDAVSADGIQRITLAQGADLLDVISATATSVP